MLLFYFMIIKLILANDINNNSILLIHIHEKLPTDTLIYSSISSLNTFQWLPSSYLYQNYFTIKNNHSLYTTNKIINRKEFCERKFCNCSLCLINLNFLQTYSLNNVTVRTIQIIIEDINDHSPIFKQSTMKYSISENVPIGYEILLESAIDDDYGLFSIQNYQLLPVLNNPFDLIVSSKPILKLNQLLDREKQSNYLFKLLAYDGGQPSLSGEQNIEIIIKDVNDNAPIFDQMIYHRSIPENERINSFIVRLHAQDRDEGDNARLSYTLDESSSTFRINNQTGDIYLNKILDYEKIRSYTMTIKAYDHGVPQLNNYATLIIDVTDVNDHTPNVLLTQVNGTIMNNPLINLPECTFNDTPLLYIYVNDDDSAENAHIDCRLNDTRFNLILLTTNAYSLQLNGTSIIDYENEKQTIVNLRCFDYGLPSLSSSISIEIRIENCNDNSPNILFPLPLNQSLLISYETIQIPYIVTQILVEDRDHFDSDTFRYTFTVTPSLDLILNENGTLILESMPMNPGLFTININVYDTGNLTNHIEIPLNIYSLNKTYTKTKQRRDNRILFLFLLIFIIIFLTAVFISICFLLSIIYPKKPKRTQNSSCESTISSNERTGSSQKTIIEVFDEKTNSSNRIYQYGFEQAVNSKVINTSGIDQRDFNFSEKVERYLTHLNDRDDGIYGSSDISFDHEQQLTTTRLPVNSIKQVCHRKTKDVERLYSVVESRRIADLDLSNSLYV